MFCRVVKCLGRGRGVPRPEGPWAWVGLCSGYRF